MLNDRLHFDVIVIGAGPAGSSAAHTLASMGLKTAIVDKKRFPREKLCGGLLTLRSAKIYGQIYNKPWDPVIQHESRGISVYHKNRLLNQIDDYKTLAFTNRRNFDQFLLTQAIEAGAIPFLGTAVKHLNTSDSSITLGDETTLRAPCIIGADGVNSMVAHALFGSAFNKTRTAFCLETELPRAATDISIDNPEISFGHVDWGYAWVFPKRDTYTVGIGGLYGQNQDFKTLFKNFSEERFSQALDCRIKGHFIPFGEFRQRPGHGNVILAGDAAGLVEPITGEGIAFAMQSGHYAGLACARALQTQNPNRALDHYMGLYNSITKEIRSANRLKHLVFRKRINRFLLAMLPRHRGVLNLHVDLMSADISYSEFGKQLFRKTSKALIRKALNSALPRVGKGGG